MIAKLLVLPVLSADDFAYLTYLKEKPHGVVSTPYITSSLLV